MNRFVTTLIAVLALAAGTFPAASQEAPAATPTPGASAAAPTPEGAPSDQERRKVRKVAGRDVETFDDLMKEWLRPRPVPKESIIRIDEKYCYPHFAAAFKVEIVREDDEYVWVRGLPPEHPDSPFNAMWNERQAEEMAYLMLEEWKEEHGPLGYLLDFTTEIVPPPFMDGLQLTPVAGGLPRGGLWQMNFVLDDMNRDGVDDLVLPPSRKGAGLPSIFLGAAGGRFVLPRGTRWASDVPYDYGGVATGDFDGDGNRDVVLAIHFKAQYVLYGDGRGSFERAERLPSPDPRLTSRAPAVADFDGDGRDDVAFVAEINYDLGTAAPIEDRPTVWVVRSTPNGWRLVTEGMPGEVIGDNLAVGDLDGDGRPDLVIASNAANWRALVVFNRADGWEAPTSTRVLANALHFDVDLFDASAGPAAYWTFTQSRIVGGEHRARAGVIRYTPGEEGLEAVDGPLYVQGPGAVAPFRLGVGDLDGDGRADLVVGGSKGGLEVYLQRSPGELVQEQSPELEGLGRAYDIQLADLDDDGRDDLLVACAEFEGGQGGVFVWLTRDRS